MHFSSVLAVAVAAVLAAAAGMFTEALYKEQGQIYFPQIFIKITLTAPPPPHLHLPPLQVTPTLNLDPPAIFHRVVLLHHQAAAVAGGFIICQRKRNRYLKHA